jgi:murein DD-endopeptidase MepM/ murein hydrolase activator NlpD
MPRPEVMRFLPTIVACLVVATLVVSAGTPPPAAPAKQAATFLANGFDFPVGKPDAEGYYKARGYRPNGHLGEDWNGKRGGDSDLGDPVFACAHGVVVYAQNFGHGWGNVVIIRHVYEEDGHQKYVDSLYGHLDQIQTRYGVHVKRGQQIGTIGTGGGLYDAHLHFEMRKELRLGMARHRFPRDDRSYYSPTDFIEARRQLAASAATAMVPIETFVQFNLTAAADEEAAEPAGFVLPDTKGGPAKKDWKPKRYDESPKR